MKVNVIRNNMALFFISLFIGFSLVWNLNQYPILWFDEGWIMSVAKNWIQLGHYGQLLNGIPIPASMLNIGFPAIGPVALSFASFGVGIWQGRLPSVLFAAGSFFLIYQLSKYLYGQVIATATLITALVLIQTSINPIFIGRQVLGEMPAMFYLLAGYYFLMFAWQNSLAIFLAALFYGLSMITKTQVVPFLITALLIPLLFLMLNRDWKQSRIMAAVLIATLILYQIMVYIQRALLGYDLPPETRIELYLTTAFVPVLKLRLITFFDTLKDAPIILGLGYVLYEYLRNRQKPPLKNNLQIIHLSLVVLALTWFAWFIFLSIGWRRYLFPCAFISSIFIAILLNDLTNGFESCRKLFGVFAIIIISQSTLPFIYNIAIYKIAKSEKSIVVEVANFLNNCTSNDALIETYDMELFIFLKRRYHYPPDIIQLQLNRRKYLRQDIKITYDPLEANPDYLVIGPFSTGWKLYDQLLKTGEFRLIKKLDGYKIYSRVRCSQDHF